jgi:hypothetical protein
MAIACLLLVLLASCSSSGSAPSPTDSSATLDATSDGFPLAALVRSAAPGSTIRAPAGTYHEQVEIRKPLTFEPVGDGPVIIDGDCKRENGISISTGSDITVTGIVIQNTVGAGVQLGNGPDDVPKPHDITLDNLTITDFNCKEDPTQAFAGIAAWYTGCCIKVMNNTIKYRSSGNQLGSGDGVWFKSNTKLPSGGGHLISGNTITGGWDGIGGETESDPHGSFDGNTVIENNYVVGCWDDGIQAEGGDQNVHVQNNRVQGCGTGIAFAAPVTGPLYVEHNTIHELSTGMLGNLFCFKVGNNGGGLTYLNGNVCSTDGDGIAQTNEGLSPIVSRGNCFHVTGYVFAIGGPVPGGSSFDGDGISSSNPDHWAKWNGSAYNDIDQFRRDTGFELNGSIVTDCADLMGQ